MKIFLVCLEHGSLMLDRHYFQVVEAHHDYDTAYDRKMWLTAQEPPPDCRMDYTVQSVEVSALR